MTKQNQNPSSIVFEQLALQKQNILISPGSM